MICLLGVDLGTSGTKTVLFDAEGREVASQSVEYPLYQPQNGWAEQDPRDWWNAAVSTIRGVLEKSGVNPGDVKGLGISGQMHGLVMLDENGEEARFSHILTFLYEGERYVALEPIEEGAEQPEEEEEAEIVLMHIVRGEDGDTYQPVENEVLLDEVFGRFCVGK
mgnify:CR=1 FL=1